MFRNAIDIYNIKKLHEIDIKKMLTKLQEQGQFPLSSPLTCVRFIRSNSNLFTYAIKGVGIFVQECKALGKAPIGQLLFRDFGEHNKNYALKEPNEEVIWSI